MIARERDPKRAAEAEANRRPECSHPPAGDLVSLFCRSCCVSISDGEILDVGGIPQTEAELNERAKTMLRKAQGNAVNVYFPGESDGELERLLGNDTPADLPKIAPYRPFINTPELFHAELHDLMSRAERCGLERTEIGAILLHMMTDAFVRGGGTADDFADAARTMFHHVEKQIATEGS